MADPSLGGEIPSGAAGAGIVGIAWAIKTLWNTFQQGRKGASEDRARDAATDLSVAGGWKEVADRMECRVAKLEQDRETYFQDRVTWLARERQLESELSAARSRIAQLEQRVAELERAADTAAALDKITEAAITAAAKVKATAATRAGEIDNPSAEPPPDRAGAD